MTAQVIVDRCYRGPPESGNGGYVCGLLAGYIDGVAEVALRLPPPLDVAMDVVPHGDGNWTFETPDGVVAIAKSAELEIDVPAPPSLADARAAEQRYRGYNDHPFSSCFVCGPDREEGDGMRLFPGPVGDAGMVAASWRPDASLAGEGGVVRTEFIWAALDCPGYFAVAAPGEMAVLGTMTASVEGKVIAGEHHIVTAWPTARDGRKLYCGCALFNGTGDLIAKAKHVWILLGRK